MTERGREQWERLTPEQRAAVERLRARNQEPARKAEMKRMGDEDDASPVGHPTPREGGEAGE